MTPRPEHFAPQLRGTPAPPARPAAEGAEDRVLGLDTGRRSTGIAGRAAHRNTRNASSIEPLRAANGASLEARPRRTGPGGGRAKRGLRRARPRTRRACFACCARACAEARATPSPSSSSSSPGSPSASSVPFSAFFRTWLGRKVSTRRALISISSPVCGLRPTRDFLSRTMKFPKPLNLDLLAALERLLDGVEDHLDDLGGLLLGEAHLLVDALDDVGLGHGLAPVRRSAKYRYSLAEFQIDCQTRARQRGRPARTLGAAPRQLQLELAAGALAAPPASRSAAASSSRVDLRAARAPARPALPPARGRRPRCSASTTTLAPTAATARARRADRREPARRRRAAARGARGAPRRRPTTSAERRRERVPGGERARRRRSPSAANAQPASRRHALPSQLGPERRRASRSTMRACAASASASVSVRSGAR